MNEMMKHLRFRMRAALALSALALALLCWRQPAAAAPLQPAAPAAIEDPSGVHLAVLVNGAGDPPRSAGLSSPPGGHWVALDVTVTNTGLLDFTLIPSQFLLQSGDAFTYRASDDQSPSQPQFEPTTLASGETARVSVLFDIPTGKTLQSAIFQAQGTAQYVIASLTS